MPNALIVGLGEVLWDLYDDEKFLGGAPSNVVCHAMCLGFRGTLVSRVGQDALGVEAITALAKRGMQPQYIQRDPHLATGTVRVILSENSIPSFQCSTNAAFDKLTVESNWDDLLPMTQAVVFGTTGQRDPVARNATQYFIRRVLTGLKVYDVNFRRFDQRARATVEDGMAMADIVKVNEGELVSMWENAGDPPRAITEFAQRLVNQYHLATLLITLGPHGAVAVTPDKSLYDPGYVLTPLDTTGAGDAFTAGFTARTLEGDSVEASLKFANLLGAFCATRRGGAPEYTLADVETFRKVKRDRLSHRRWKTYCAKND